MARGGPSRKPATREEVGSDGGAGVVGLALRFALNAPPFGLRRASLRARPTTKTKIRTKNAKLIIREQMRYYFNGIETTIPAVRRKADCRPTEVSEQKAKPDRSRAIKTGHLDKLRTLGGHRVTAN